MVISYNLRNKYLALWIEEYQYCKMSVDHLKSVSPIRDHRAAALSWTADRVVSETDIQNQQLKPYPNSLHRGIFTNTLDVSTYIFKGTTINLSMSTTTVLSKEFSDQSKVCTRRIRCKIAMWEHCL